MLLSNKDPLVKSNSHFAPVKSAQSLFCSVFPLLVLSDLLIDSFPGACFEASHPEQPFRLPIESQSAASFALLSSFPLFSSRFLLSSSAAATMKLLQRLDLYRQSLL